MEKKIFRVWYTLFGRVVYNLVEATTSKDAVSRLRDFGRTHFIVRER